MSRKFIAIGLPTFGTVSMKWALAYDSLLMPMNSAKAVLCKQGLPVDIARNRIVNEVLALDPRPTHIFWLDDDVLINKHVLLQLLKADVDIVSGVYFTKSEFSEPLIYQEFLGGSVQYEPGSGVIPAWGIPGGLTLVKTDVYLRMFEAGNLGTDVQGNPRWYYTSGDDPEEELRTTEDLYFCDQARSVGFQSHVDTSPYAFAWHYDAKKRIGYPTEQWREFVTTGGVVSFPISDAAAAKIEGDQPETEIGLNTHGTLKAGLELSQ